MFAKSIAVLFLAVIAFVAGALSANHCPLVARFAGKAPTKKASPCHGPGDCPCTGCPCDVGGECDCYGSCECKNCPSFKGKK